MEVICTAKEARHRYEAATLAASRGDAVAQSQRGALWREWQEAEEREQQEADLARAHERLATAEGLAAAEAARKKVIAESLAALKRREALAKKLDKAIATLGDLAKDFEKATAEARTAMRYVPHGMVALVALGEPERATLLAILSRELGSADREAHTAPAAFGDWIARRNERTRRVLEPLATEEAAA